MSMEPDLYSLATLLRATGRSAVEIARAYNATSPSRRISSQTVVSWLRGPDTTRLPGRPRWDVLAGLADVLTIPRATMYAACAGESDARSYSDGVADAREEADAARRWWAAHVGISEGEEANQDQTVADAMAAVVGRIDALDVEPRPAPDDLYPFCSRGSDGR